jgi:hypothetical protein
VAASTAFAGTSRFGPQDWPNGQQSGRYRAATGAHHIKPSACAGQKSVELRLDIIGGDDNGYGTHVITCGSSSTWTNIPSSNGSQFRGNFMQTHSSDWFGTLADTHA